MHNFVFDLRRSTFVMIKSSYRVYKVPFILFKLNTCINLTLLPSTATWNNTLYRSYLSEKRDKTGTEKVDTELKAKTYTCMWLWFKKCLRLFLAELMSTVSISLPHVVKFFKWVLQIRSIFLTRQSKWLIC